MTIDAPLPHLPVEPAFDEIVQCAGGRRVDALVDGEIEWENADYYFDSVGVVAELKEVTHDASTDQGLRDRLSEIYRRHAGRDDMPTVFSTAPIRIDLLPEDVRREMMLPFKRKLEGCVRKAARQIKETKVQLHVPDAKGLLILVNEASTCLRPDLAFYFLHHILKGQYSSIDQVIYCSINMLLDGHDVPYGVRFWANGVIEGRSEIPDEFVQRLQESFRQVVDKQTGVPGTPISCDPGHIGALNFVKRPLASAPDFFVQPKRFYRSPPFGCNYYCEAVEGGTATMWLVESFQRGQLIQAVFTQKLVYANRDRYVAIEDRGEVARLKVLLRDLHRKDKAYG